MPLKDVKVNISLRINFKSCKEQFSTCMDSKALLCILAHQSVFESNKWIGLLCFHINDVELLMLYSISSYLL